MLKLISSFKPVTDAPRKGEPARAQMPPTTAHPIAGPAATLPTSAPVAPRAGSWDAVTQKLLNRLAEIDQAPVLPSVQGPTPAPTAPRN